MLAFRLQTGGFELLDILRADWLHIEFLVQEKAGPTKAVGQLEVKDADPPTIVVSDLQAIPPGMSAADMAVKVDAAVRTCVIDGIVANLSDLYVFPDIAKKMVEALRSHQKKGEYDAIESGYAFASKLTEQLQAVSHDKHLRVRCVPTALPKLARDPLEKPPIDDEMRAQLERSRWTDVLVIVEPETIIRWHRSGFRRYWTWLSRRNRPVRPAIVYRGRTALV
jgi:hypothetical protein